MTVVPAGSSCHPPPPRISPWPPSAAAPTWWNGRVSRPPRCPSRRSPAPPRPSHSTSAACRSAWTRPPPSRSAAGTAHSRPATISFTEVSILRWISPAADGALDMTVGSLLPVAPSLPGPQHPRPASDDPRHKPRASTDRNRSGRFMLTYVGGPTGHPAGPPTGHVAISAMPDISLGGCYTPRLVSVPTPVATS